MQGRAEAKHDLIPRVLAVRVDKSPAPVGASLPPERVLCERYRVSRMTLRQAFDVLAREGLILQQRARPSSRLISFVRQGADPEAQALFALAQHEAGYRITRVRFADDVPLALEIVRIPVRLCPDLDRLPLAAGSLYQILEEHYGLRPSRSVEEISASLADQRQRKLLGLRRPSAVLIIERKTYTDNMYRLNSRPLSCGQTGIGPWFDHRGQNRVVKGCNLPWVPVAQRFASALRILRSACSACSRCCFWPAAPSARTSSPATGCRD